LSCWCACLKSAVAATTLDSGNDNLSYFSS
jgi:hypothetical protein